MSTTPHSIVRNTVANSLSFAFLFVSNLFLLPFIVHHLGEVYYGNIWVILGALTSYMGLIDLGAGTSFVKFISEYYTKGERAHLLEVIDTGIAFYLVVGALLMTVTWFAGKTILELVGVPGQIMDDAVFVLRISMLVFVIVNVISPLTSVLIGLQRMEINAYIFIGTQAFTIAGTVFVLLSGYGVRGLILNNLATILLNAVAVGWFAFRLVPDLKFRTRYCKLSMARRFFGYGANMQVSKIAQIVLFQTDRILCLRLFGGGTSTYYDIGAKMNNTTRSIGLLSVSALVPAVAELDALEHREKIMMLYRRGSKYIVVVASFLFMFVCVFAPQILLVWFGEEKFLASVAFVRVLSLGYFFNVISGVASSLAAGMGRTDYDRRYGIFSAAINLIAVVALSLALGPIGIALGTALSLTLGAIYYLHLFHGFIGAPLTELFRIFGRALLTGILAGAVAWIGVAILPISAPSRLMQGAVLIAIFVVYSGVFAGALALLRVFDPYDWQLLRSIRGKVA